MVNVIDYYLDDKKPKDVQTLAAKSALGAQDEALLQGFVLEALRTYQLIGFEEDNLTLLCRSPAYLPWSVS